MTPWLLLALYLLYNKTWGRCECPALRRRLVCAHREYASLQNETRYYVKKYYEKEEIT